MRKYFLLLIVLSSLTFAGCIRYDKVGGKVLLTDGTPVTTGKVCFENGSFAVTGDIHKDGTYRMGRLKDGDGIPPGSYKIVIMGAMIGEISDAPEASGSGAARRAASPSFHMIQLVDSKYLSTATSGLEVEVKGSMTHDIVVDPPRKK